MTRAPTDGRGPWRRFACALCAHVYDEAEGDPASGVAPGTRFDDLPRDWVCPDCGAPRDQFLPL